MSSGNQFHGVTLAEPLSLDGGGVLENVFIAYETYGALNEAKSNAILICHALTGDQFVAGPNPNTGRPAWWANMVGPGKLIDTDKYFVICSNVLGGCMGSSGPASLKPDGKNIWGLDFPVITIADMVRAQTKLVDLLGIDQLFALLGGSMGGMQVLEWMAAYPHRLANAIVIASAANHTAQNIALHELGRQAVMADPLWHDGAYFAHNAKPEKGLAVARMAAHISYMSDAALQRKFGRSLQDRESLTYGFEADFQVESYLRHQGSSFVERFDANAYLYITRAMDYFDLAASHDGSLVKAFARFTGRACVLSFSSDWHYPPPLSRALTRAMMAAGVEVSALEIKTDKGHDAFLLDEPVMEHALTGFLSAAATKAGLK